MPQRLLTILEGEGLVNDATALILLSFAVGAVESGGLSIPSALGVHLTPILRARRRDVQGEPVTQRVHRPMHLGALLALGPVIAALS